MPTISSKDYSKELMRLSRLVPKDLKSLALNSSALQDTFARET